MTRAVKVCILDHELLPDLVEEVPARGAICHVGCTTNHVPDKRARVTVSEEDLVMRGVVDTMLG